MPSPRAAAVAATLALAAASTLLTASPVARAADLQITVSARSAAAQPVTVPGNPGMSGSELPGWLASHAGLGLVGALMRRRARGD